MDRNTEEHRGGGAPLCFRLEPTVVLGVPWASRKRPSPGLSPMNCREFRSKHAAYVDDTLSGVDIDAMALHRQLCERCSQLDTRVRRALLVARNLPTIEPSAAFSERLQARLAEERKSGELLRYARDPMMPVARWM